MKTFQFNKLVRDKIPAAIKSRGAVKVSDTDPRINHYRQNSARYREIIGNKHDIGNFQVGVVITLVNKTNKIFMAKRSSDAANAPGRWETVSGRIASGETPEQTIRREIAEELGTEIKFKMVEPYYTFRITRDDGCELIGISYYCKYLGGAIHLNEEHTESRWVTVNEAIQLTQTPGLKKELQYFKKKYLSLHNSPRPR
jgi:8-oxo-dGTP diphosphatase